MNRAATSLATLALAGALAGAASPAIAHLAPGEYGSFATGFSHPLFGLDHVLAMVAVGLWAALIGGRALWMLPAAFVAAMVVGFALALAGAGLPMVEPMILASTVVFGLVVALALRTSARVAAGLVAAFGLFHGAAHGAELDHAGIFAFGAGFVANTALLHLAGIGLGLAALRLGGPNQILARATGVLTAVLGLGILLV